MSVDRKLEQVCTHAVADEFLLVNSDRQTVVPLRPISSADSVMVRVNGLVEVPSFGVQVPANVVGTREGPFTLTATNNRLVVQVNDDPPQTVELPSSFRLPPARLAESLTSALQGLSFYVERNKVGVKSTSSGRFATFRFLPASTMLALLGLPPNRVYRGKDAFPGWILVSDPSTLEDRPRRFVYFDEPLLDDSSFVEVSYTTVQQECRRCGGIGIEHDWRYGPDGKVIMARDEVLLLQEMLKVMYTIKGSNPFHSWYGTSIVERIGAKNASSGVLHNAITTDVYAAFSNWQKIKKAQEGPDIGQSVSDEEFPFRLVSVKLEQSQNDPTVLFLNIEVQNRSFKPFTLTRGLRLSDSLTLNPSLVG